MIDTYACERALRDGLDKLEIVLSDQQIALLIAYLAQFHKWNKAYNLSAIRDPLAMVERHLLDSLVLVPLFREHGVSELDSQRIIDVGTGGGLPGIPLSIVFPDRQWVLLDSNGKKTRFLFQVKVALGLDNVQVENTRVERYQPDSLFDVVVSRAFASLEDMVTGSRHLLNEKGRFWAMKGIYPQKELRDCEKHAIVESAISLEVPDQEGERHLLILKPLS